ncbi:GPI-anchored cell surface glycoprotein, putative [Talaromyces stipitatus ATCC 10500]|uniref:GPI-anchored cell surface glycoprotein, putative n=1 Tax=Talaromyces stipitatus (strain ATCC 10500 / CBS 375.48 / QM 6759 / NRRL 1006) TaxID=441959 RepID=B8MHX5_TALSN|nr:GPI-anchored cell surface glycoprotein, putative [Talaromyces stipitatus ATCC 10500]EED16455.1 GPI-anchored cell surface glycoprotein, putative [Talaromyces stipitatus ATCC 10500]
MAAHEDIQKSSSLPSTPQSFLYYDNDSPFAQSGNDELWHSSKRRRTQQRPSSETQFIHMNGYKSDSQLGTRFNNTYVDSYSDSKTVDNTQNKSADAVSTSEETPGAVAESASKASDDQLEVLSAKSVRSSRKAPIERSTETSSRVLKVKSSTGSSQPTNIQTFIFKTKLDPRNLNYRDRSDEPGTPSSVTETPEVNVENSSAESSTRSTRKTRKSEANMLKFKSYTPNATPVLRNNNTSRKPSRQDQSVEAESPAPTTIIDDQTSQGILEQDSQRSPERISQLETPLKENDAMEGNGEANSAQRRSTRVRKPVKNILLEETPKKEKFIKNKGQGSTTAAQLSRSLSKPVNTNATESVSHTSPPARQTEAVHLPGDFLDRYGTPSPDNLSVTRSSGRLRKPTIKAIEALQSKPQSRKRLRNSDQVASSDEPAPKQSKITPELAQPANTSTVSTSCSTSGSGSDAPSVLMDETEILGRQLYDLASEAIMETVPSVEEEEAKIAEWREAFNRKRNEQVSTPAVENQVAETAEPTETTEPTEAVDETPPVVIEYLDLPGEINADVPLDHPQRPRPWTEKDGWMHTGRVNQHGEEYCVAPADRYQWVKHTSNYKTPVGPIPTPPPLIKSVDEIRRDNIYGFPPSPGQRNLYQKHPGQVWRYEDVEDLVSQTPSHTKSLRSAAKQVDAMNVDESEGFPRFKRPLKIVFVDSSKLDLSKLHQDAMLSQRRRRRTAASFANDFKSTPSKPTGDNQRKRSFDMTAGSHIENSNQNQPQRKKRQSTAAKVEDKATSARSKRQSTVGNVNSGTNKNNQPSSSTIAPQKSANTGPKATSKETAPGTNTGRPEKISLKFHFGSHSRS